VIEVELNKLFDVDVEAFVDEGLVLVLIEEVGVLVVFEVTEVESIVVDESVMLVEDRIETTVKLVEVLNEIVVLNEAVEVAEVLVDVVAEGLLAAKVNELGDTKEDVPVVEDAKVDSDNDDDGDDDIEVMVDV